MSYSSFASKSRSQKIILAHLQAKHKVKVFELVSGTIYKKKVNHFVTQVKVNGAYLVKKDDINLYNGEFYFSPEEGYIYLNIGSAPELSSIYLTYKFFFSNIPVNLPSEITYGDVVHYEPRIKAIGNLKLELDYEATGIAMETSSSISLDSNDGYFLDIFDKYIWENNQVKFWSWSKSISLDEAKLIYRGLISEKSYTETEVRFSLKDELSKLRQVLDMPRFSELDGNLDSSLIGKPKRLIFGRADQLRVTAIDKTLEGYELTGTLSGNADRNLLSGTVSGTFIDNNLTGTVSANANSTTITGVGTSFTTQLAVGNQIKVIGPSVSYTFTVSAITSNTQLTVSSTISVAFTGFSAKNMSIGSKVINGADTLFTTQLNVGSKIKVIGAFVDYNFTVATIVSNTQLTVTEFLPASFSGYQIRSLDVLNNIITGTGTSFLSELSPNDKLVFTLNEAEYEYSIKEVTSDTQVIIDDEVETNFTDIKISNVPEIPYRRKNRRYSIAGHKLREYSVTITSIEDSVNIVVDDINDIQTGDYLEIKGNSYIVVRTFLNKIRINQSLIGSVVVGDSVKKLPVSTAFADKTRFVIDRDFTVENNLDHAVLVFNEYAEFNVATNKSPSVQFNFTQNSRVVSSSGSTVDLTTIIKPRDFIKARSINLSDWYEVLSVSSTEITLRTPSLVTFSGNISYKSPSYINDNSVVLVNCLGLDNGDWVRYPANAVKYLLNSINLDEINNDSFIEAANDCNYDLCLYYPSTIGSELPKIRDMITDINRSVFGSLYLDNNFLYTYRILNSDKPADLSPIKDEDIIKFSVSTKNNIINSVLLNYAPYTDLDTEIDTQKSILLESDYVNEAVEKEERLEITSYLYNEKDAQNIAERWLFFRSLTQSVVTIDSKLTFATNSLNDAIMLELSKLYKRFGSSTYRKVGIINSITKTADTTQVQINDLGNIFSRVPSIAPDTEGDYEAGSISLDKYGYVLDNSLETPSQDEDELESNLIG